MIMQILQFNLPDGSLNVVSRRSLQHIFGQMFYQYFVFEINYQIRCKRTKYFNSSRFVSIHVVSSIFHFIDISMAGNNRTF